MQNKLNRYCIKFKDLYKKQTPVIMFVAILTEKKNLRKKT